MLIPRYSLRWLLGLTTFSAGVSLILSYAIRGHAWAIGMAAGLWSLVIVGLFYVAAFMVAWLVANAATRKLQPGGGSPFATGKDGELPFGASSAGRQQPAAESPPMTG